MDRLARFLRSDLSALILLAAARLLLHILTNDQYGFHRDELAMLDDSGRLAWGYVAYPPVTPVIGRVALELFGPSLVGVRFFSALAMCASMVLTGLMARQLGGSRRAQLVAALAAGLAPISLIQGALFQYVSFDYLWWVLLALLVLELLQSDDPRWWLAIGAVVGLGMMTKYTIAFFIAGLVGGVLVTGGRRYLTSPWLWAGVAISLVLFLPNALWQVRQDFITLDFLTSIRLRDIAVGRTQGFIFEQFLVASNLFLVPFWIAGLYFYFFKPAGARYRMLGWMYVIPFVLFVATRGRSYYLAPAYPMLIGAGVIVWEGWLSGLARKRAGLVRTTTWAALLLGGILFIPVMLPVAPINSPLWDLTTGLHDNFVEEIGWRELTETVAQIYFGLPAGEREHTAILAGNYGEAGAINLYGPALGLPRAISGRNSYWLRGYGDPAPETVIVLGFSAESAETYFADCEWAGRISNSYGVENEETRLHPTIFVCRGNRQPWPELWDALKSFS